MKITLGELALLPVSFLVGTLLISLAGDHLDSQARVTYRWQIAVNDVRILRLCVMSYPGVGKTPADIDTVNQYFSHSLGNLPRFSELEGLDNRFDPWGNPYVCVERQEDSDERYRPWHFYSTGRDGKSATSGNDADDICSWKEPQVAADYYRSDVRKRTRTAATLIGLVYSPFVFLALVFLKRRYLGHPFQSDH